LEWSGRSIDKPSLAFLPTTTTRGCQPHMDHPLPSCQQTDRRLPGHVSNIYWGWFVFFNSLSPTNVFLKVELGHPVQVRTLRMTGVPNLPSSNDDRRAADLILPTEKSSPTVVTQQTGWSPPDRHWPHLTHFQCYPGEEPARHRTPLETWDRITF